MPRELIPCGRCPACLARQQLVEATAYLIKGAEAALASGRITADQYARIHGHIERGEPIPDDFMTELGVTPP